MDKFSYYLQKIIGKKNNTDIYNANGVLLVPKSFIITYDHVMLLEENGITLTEEAVTDIGTFTNADYNEYYKLIDEAVEETSRIFKEIRRNRKIPLAELRKDVIPLIQNVSENTNVLQLFVALQAKDDYTYRHNIAVGALANLIGKWMNLARQELMQLTTAALLHDVGKMLISETILNKPGKLTDEEYAIMKKHTIYGYEILNDTVGISHRQALVALQHHERMNGSGYPIGIKGDNIDLFSRIVAVADIFHAMTSNRVYRTHSPFYEVLTEMEEEMFGELDPEITLVFIEKTMNYLIGCSVLLTDGRIGTIIMVPKNKPTRPLIKVGEQFIDLTKESQIHIERII